MLVLFLFRFVIDLSLVELIGLVFGSMGNFGIFFGGFGCYLSFFCLFQALKSYYLPHFENYPQF